MYDGIDDLDDVVDDEMFESLEAGSDGLLSFYMCPCCGDRIRISDVQWLDGNEDQFICPHCNEIVEMD